MLTEEQRKKIRKIKGERLKKEIRRVLSGCYVDFDGGFHSFDTQDIEFEGMKKLMALAEKEGFEPSFQASRCSYGASISISVWCELTPKFFEVESVEIGICPHCGAEDLTEDFELDLRVEYVSIPRSSEEFLCKGPCWDAVMSPKEF